MLEDFGFQVILVDAKSNYVFTIDGVKTKLSLHKQQITLQEGMWGCSKLERQTAESPTFGKLVLLFFRDKGKCRCMMVFGRPLRAAELLAIWHQHHGSEQFWRHLKSILLLSAMSLHGQDGAYASLGVKVLADLLLLAVSQATGETLQQIQLQRQGQIHLFFELREHFQEGAEVQP